MIMNIPKNFEYNVVVSLVISFEISYTWPKPITAWEASPTRFYRATYENTFKFTLSEKFEHLPLDKTLRFQGNILILLSQIFYLNNEMKTGKYRMSGFAHALM